jgi:Flp pilus assembly protein TadD
MTTPFRFGSAVSLAALGSMIAGCAAPQHSVASLSKADGEVALASRAAAALEANDFATAVSFAERAVERTPEDPSLRTLLGNAYFGAGRFRSAEGAYKDSLALSSNQGKVILKLALVETALGKNAEALAFLDAGRSVLEPADYGLAVALAGRPAAAIQVLEAAARAPGADSRIRQNLALALGLAGDWTNARTVAAQDVPANLLDARIQQWMQFANPAKATDQVAALVGVTPAAVDQGRPERLALVKSDVRTAQAVPAPVTVPAQHAPVQLASAEPDYFPEAKAAAPAAPAAPTALETAAETATAPAMAALAAVAAAEAPAALAALAPKFAPKLLAAVAKPKVKPIRAAVAKAERPAVRSGNSTAVVQLGAYGSADRVLAAWNNAARKYPAVRAYMPMSARFNGPKGLVYRLSVKGFASSDEAANLCIALRRSGGSCFVRQFAGDTPVHYASR